MLGIVFFNLLIPYGELLFNIGPLAITKGALEGGIRRAVTLEGLFMLSRCSVRKDITIPGFFGEIVGESFRIFSQLAEEKLTLKRQNWAGRLDEILLALQRSPEENKPPMETSIKKRSLATKIVLVVVVILSWLLFLLSKL